MNKQLICKDTKTLSLVEGSMPEAPANGLTLKVLHAGICHSDAHLYFEESHKAVLPKILGHEISGTVHQLGKGYSGDNLHVGDRVVVYTWGGCRDCPHCRVEKTNICSNMHGPHAHVYGVWKQGGYQEFMAVDDIWSVIKVPDSIPLDVACLVPCSGISAYNAVEQCNDSITASVDITGHANVLIVGAGGLGLWAIQIVKTLYGDTVKVLAADLNEAKLSEAKSSGADVTVMLPREGDAKDIAAKIKDSFDGEGVDAAIDFVNNQITFERIFHSLRSNATTVMVGIPLATMPPVIMFEFILRNLRVQGIYAGTKKQVQEVFTLLVEGKIKGPRIEAVGLKDVESVLEKMISGTLLSGRAVVDMKRSSKI